MTSPFKPLAKASFRFWTKLSLTRLHFDFGKKVGQDFINFGFFQGFIPLLGYYSGKGLSSWIEDYAPWIAFILLLFIGGKNDL